MNIIPRNPIIHSLLSLIQVEGISVGSIATGVMTYIGNKVEKQNTKLFFENIEEGNYDGLNPEMLETDDFIRKFNITYQFVKRAESDQKIVRFSSILKALLRGNVDTREYHDLLKIFDELTDLEFLILSILYSFELKNVSEEKNIIEVFKEYWPSFIEEVKKQTGLSEIEIQGYLGRMQRTGCYHVYQGYIGAEDDNSGMTTILFHKIHKVVQAETN